MNNTQSPARRRPVDSLLWRYTESHRHPVNELIHCICVPAIVFTLLGMIWSLHPLAAYAVVLTALIYYFFLSSRLALGMLLMAACFLSVLGALPVTLIRPVCAGVFVLAWIGQFIGHHIEGKKPSFFEDLRFLLIGPLFVLGVLYRRLRIPY